MGLNDVHVESQGKDEYMRDQKHLENMRAALNMVLQVDDEQRVKIPD